jgi:hypothetical protein
MQQLAGVTSPQGAHIFKHYATSSHSSSNSDSTTAAATTAAGKGNSTIIQVTHVHVNALMHVYQRRSV